MPTSLVRLATAAALACLALPHSAVGQTPVPPASDSTDAMIRTLVARLDFDRYKATVKGLTAFGDRRQGTDRNRAAVDWIEAQLKSYGCSNTERITYEFRPPAPTPRPAGNTTPPAIRREQGGGRSRGVRTPTGVNTDSMKQPDVRLRRLNAQPTTPGERQEVYCTK
ncbi:MAG TPA: peptidase M28, partial [Gemmatimonadaceae bacterium]|nr:peptidase M28 [Gemmatimonadaceae bacterium]